MAKPALVIRHKNSEGEYTPAGCIWATQRGMNIDLNIKVGDEFVKVKSFTLENGDEYEADGFFNVFFNGEDEEALSLLHNLMQTQLERNVEFAAKKASWD